MDSFWNYFYEIYDTLPRQGPGQRESTLRALRMLPVLSSSQRILDIGCGSGAQTLDLAEATDARIVAVDNHAAFIERLEAGIAQRGLGARVEARVGDMTDLQFPDRSFDVLWAEGSIFIIGFDKGLSEWRRLLVPGGYAVVSEFCWFRDNPPAELKEMFLDGNPDVGDVAARRKSIAAAGYELVGDFELPSAGWTENYHAPLGEAVKRFRAAHANEPEALAVAASCQREIDGYRKYPGHYGYVFFVMKV